METEDTDCGNFVDGICSHSCLMYKLFNSLGSPLSDFRHSETSLFGVEVEGIPCTNYFDSEYVLQVRTVLSASSGVSLYLYMHSNKTEFFVLLLFSYIPKQCFPRFIFFTRVGHEIESHKNSTCIWPL